MLFGKIKALVEYGVRTGLISVPQRNMHPPAEICDFEDMENIAKLIAAYITDKEAQPNA